MTNLTLGRPGNPHKHDYLQTVELPGGGFTWARFHANGVPRKAHVKDVGTQVSSHLVFPTAEAALADAAACNPTIPPAPHADDSLHVWCSYPTRWHWHRESPNGQVTDQDGLIYDSPEDAAEAAIALHADLEAPLMHLNAQEPHHPDKPPAKRHTPVKKKPAPRKHSTRKR